MRVTRVLSLLLVGSLATGSFAQDDPNAIGITLDTHWSVSAGVGLGATDESLVRAGAMYWPDYATDGGIGIVAIGGDMIPEDKIVLGPALEFPTGAIYEGAASTILPDKWVADLGKLAAPIRPYGALELLFTEDFDPILGVGTVNRLWPNKHVQPTLRNMYYQPSGNIDGYHLEGFWTTFDLMYAF